VRVRFWITIWIQERNFYHYGKIFFRILLITQEVVKNIFEGYDMSLAIKRLLLVLADPDLNP